MWNKFSQHQKGFTLIELILAITIIAVGLAGVLTVYQNSVKASGNPTTLKQMTAIAEGMMEEILLKPYAVSANSAAASCARDTYNDVRDYNGYTCANASNITGVTTAAGYAVSVSVTTTTAAPFNALLSASDALQIVVTVSKTGQTYTLTGWRTNYAGP